MYNAQHFIDKFTTIPDEKWTTRTFENSNGQCCALGHCGDRDYNATKEGRALFDLVFNHKPFGIPFVAEINDNLNKKLPQRTPKERILAALKVIQENGG